MGDCRLWSIIAHWPPGVLTRCVPCAQAILSRQRAETLSSVLYPDDRTFQGKELRLKQQHFFVSATIQARGLRWLRRRRPCVGVRGALAKAASLGAPGRSDWPRRFWSVTRRLHMSSIALYTECHMQIPGRRLAVMNKCKARVCNFPIAGVKKEGVTSILAARQDVVRRYKETHSTFDAFADKVAFQMNDTHPTIAVAELMRVLMDECQLGWTRAWELTTKASPLAPPRAVRPAHVVRVPDAHFGNPPWEWCLAQHLGTGPETASEAVLMWPG
jgi:hypothetical protein